MEKLKDTGFPGLGTGRGMHPVYEARRTSPGSFSLIATRYFHQYEIDPEKGKEMIGKIAVKNHDNGSLFPKAHFHNRITLEDVMKAPIIAWPLGLYDCCGVTEGAAAAIIVRADMAKTFRPDPIYVKSLQIAVSPEEEYRYKGWDGTHVETTCRCAAKAYEEAGIKNPREELSLFEVHDCFSITELVIYEDLMINGARIIREREEHASAPISSEANETYARWRSEQEKESRGVVRG